MKETTQFLIVGLALGIGIPLFWSNIKRAQKK
jgi:hypothetical protein